VRRQPGPLTIAPKLRFRAVAAAGNMRRRADKEASDVMSVLLLHISYVVAITAEAMTAALAAGRRSMDWVGVCMLGAVTALGGGSVRDVLLGHQPLIWVAHPVYLLLTAAAALATVGIARFMPRLRGLFL